MKLNNKVSKLRKIFYVIENNPTLKKDIQKLAKLRPQLQ